MSDFRTRLLLAFHASSYPTQRHLARAAELSYASLSSYLSGARSPSPAAARRLARALDAPSLNQPRCPDKSP